MLNSVERFCWEIHQRRLKLRERDTKLSSVFGVGAIRALDKLQMVRAGCFWVYPIARTKDKVSGVVPLLGVRLDPRQPIQQLPIVAVCHTMATTYCSSMEKAFITLSVRNQLSSDSLQDWKQFSADLMWSIDTGLGYAELSEYVVLTKLHEMIGAVIDDVPVGGKGGGLVDWPPHVERALILTDSTPATQRIGSDIKKTYGELRLRYNSDHECFPYDGLISSLIYSRWYFQGNKSMEIAQCCDLLQSLACVDGGLRRDESRFREFSNWRTEYALEMVTHLHQYLSTAPALAGHYAASRTTEAIMRYREDYDGSEHLDLAHLHISQKDWSSAWNMLVLYSFHHYRSKRLGDSFDRDVPGYVARLAFDIARRAGAPHVVALMEKMGVPDW